MSGPLIVEHVGVVGDDRGSQVRTLLEVLAAWGLTPRPGATDALAGADAAHAVTTLLVGHGHPADPSLVAEVERRWVRDLVGGGITPIAGAEAILRTEVARRPVVVVGNLPPEALEPVLGSVMPGVMLARAARGLPHPDAIRAVASAHAVPPEALTLLAHSPAMLLAAAQAGVGTIVLVGQANARWTELVPVTARVASLMAWAADA